MEKQNKLKSISYRIEDDLLIIIDDWVRKGKYPSRSAVIRVALRDKIKKNFGYY
ncbi:MAG: ribbon-helix-helix protein, CopG family [Candidatus Heimdallarchaeota archaeon]|nr:ribbon-helix-helix protein, CopG family [Candidatus Heimdallarchaeota archaeon]